MDLFIYIYEMQVICRCIVLFVCQFALNQQRKSSHHLDFAVNIHLRIYKKMLVFAINISE
jgi:hypothetical protein